MRKRFVALCGAAMMGFVVPCAADQIVRKDGTTLTGTVVAESKDAVTFESTAGGITLRQKIARSQIASLSRAVKEGPGYCPIPIRGAIGDDVSGAAFADAVRAARAAKAKYVVLVIDSPGGQLVEMLKIVDAIRANPDLTFVAYVKQAYSAAAVIAMACPQIVMAPGAQIGACVPYQIGPDGTPLAVEEKFESAVRAQMRSAAQLGGHDELWIRGMSEIDMELAVDRTPAGAAKLVVATDASPAATILKRKGQILTITASEAVANGLATAVAPDVAAARAALGLRAWHVADERPANLMEASARSLRADRARQAELLRRAMERRAYYKSAAVEARSLDQQIRRSIARCDALRGELLKLRDQRDAEAKDLQDAYNLKMKRASIAANPITTQKQLRQEYGEKVKAIEDRYRPRGEQLAADLKSAAAECQTLIEQRNALVANAPPAE
jgi:membrane-bound serine protease (ClpP class)